MGATFHGVSRHVLQIDELDSLWAHWKAHVPGFKDQIERLPVSVFLRPKGVIPLLPSFSGARISSVCVQGYLPSKSSAKDAFREVLERGKESIGRVGGLDCSIGFEEVNSKQDRQAYDVLAVSIEKGRRFIAYRANGSKVMSDSAYRWHFVEDFVRRLALPVRFKVVGEHYYLEHEDAKMEFRSSRAGWDGADPSGFKCEVDWEDDVLLSRMFELLPLISTEKRFNVHWTANTIHELPLSEEYDRTNRAFWEQIVRCEFPAQRYFVDLEVRIQTITDLEDLRRLCGPNDTNRVMLCTVAVEEEMGVVQAELTTQGYRLLFNSPASTNTARISAMLGLPFCEKG